MTAAEAKARLERMCAAASDPILEDEDLDELLRGARRRDADGVSPSESGWTPTWDLNAAAAEGWRWKAGRVTSTYSADDVGGGYSPDSFKYLNCVREAEHYASRIVMSIPIRVGP